jgi:hypothetical protein
MRKTTLTLAALIAAAVTATAQVVTVDFQNGDQFEGDLIEGGSWVVDGVTISTTNMIHHTDHIDSTWNITNGGAGGPNGVNNGAATGDGGTVFDADTEVWTFALDTDVTTWDGIVFQGFTGTDAFFVQSDDWIGLSVTTVSADVAFDSGTGTLTFSAAGGALGFTFADISTGTLLPVAAGNDISFGATNSINGGGGVRLDAFSFAVVPEPSTYAFMLGLLALGFVVRRRFNR